MRREKARLPGSASFRKVATLAGQGAPLWRAAKAVKKQKVTSRPERYHSAALGARENERSGLLNAR